MSPYYFFGGKSGGGDRGLRSASGDRPGPEEAGPSHTMAVGRGMGGPAGELGGRVAPQMVRGPDGGWFKAPGIDSTSFPSV